MLKTNTPESLKLNGWNLKITHLKKENHFNQTSKLFVSMYIFSVWSVGHNSNFIATLWIWGFEKGFFSCNYSFRSFSIGKYIIPGDHYRSPNITGFSWILLSQHHGPTQLATSQHSRCSPHIEGYALLERRWQSEGIKIWRDVLYIAHIIY